MEDKEIKALVSLLDDNDHEVLKHVESKIFSIGLEAIPFLEEAWEQNFNPEMQQRIEETIHKIQFESLIDKLTHWKEDGADDLFKGMWIVCGYLYPDVSYEEISKALEQIYYEVWLAFKYDMHPLDQIKVLNSIFFHKLRFRPNIQNFYAPNNSMLNMVLETRKGNPISLCVVYMLIAQKLKLPLYGVNLPKQFILTYKDEDMQFYISVFNKGLVFSRADIDNHVRQENLSPSPAFYEPCTTQEIIIRVFRNLYVSYKELGETQKMEEIERLLRIIEQ
ncbi:MAG: transglutaminase-like domain-containing protein [Flammeovirgaceae bacterium]